MYKLLVHIRIMHVHIIKYILLLRWVPIFLYSPIPRRPALWSAGGAAEHGAVREVVGIFAGHFYGKMLAFLLDCTPN